MKLRPLKDSLTNKIWETEHGTILKYMAASSWSLYLVNTMKAVTFNFDFQTKDDRIANEKRAKELLPTLGINTPELLSEKDGFLEMEKIDGEPLLDHLTTVNYHTRKETGIKKGIELQKLHSHGSAYVDARCGNTIVSDGTLYSIDHEMFTEDANRFLQELDIIKLTATAKLLPSSSYIPFIEGFKDGYADISVQHPFTLLLSGISSLGYAVLVEHRPHKLLNAAKNFTYDIKKATIDR